MQLGFVIDQRSCIGCHACTVACKAENGVAIGNFRTWVKYVESGTFPDSRRDFAVLRCNHCATAPCARICPVTALHKRADGVVDLDRDACIGCGACMQACPYDAIYLDEDTGVAGKCHLCAHRLERKLVAANRPTVHLRPGRLKLCRNLTRLSRHLLAGEGVGKAVVGHCVKRLDVSEAEAASGPGKQVGSVGHRLHAAADADLDVTGADRSVNKRDCTHSGCADLVDGLR